MRIRVLLLAFAKKIQFQQYLLWLGLAVVLLILAGLAVMWLRRRVLGVDADKMQAGLFEELRAMRDRGEMSIEEYDAAKATMVARASGKPVPLRAKPRASSGERVAKPGFDLTGAPLPPPRPPSV